MTPDHLQNGSSVDDPIGFGSIPVLERIRATFLAPSQLAEKIRPGSPWLDVLLISTVIALFGVATMPNEVFVEPMRDAVSRRGAPVEIVSPPEVVAQWGRAMGMLATLSTQPILAFVIAGIMLVLFVFLLRSRTNYRELLSLSSHAMLIPALGTFIAAVARLATGSASGPGSAAWLQPGPDASLFVHILASVDPFIVWMLVLLAIGIHGLDPRQSRIRASALLVAGYLGLVITSTALLHPELRAEAKERIEAIEV